MPLYPKGKAPKPMRKAYASESEASRAGARGVTYAGAKVAKGDYLSRLMAYAKARATAMANQRVYIRPGPGGLGPASPANQPGYRPPQYNYPSEAALARARQVTYASQSYPLRKQAKKTKSGYYDYPSEAEVAEAKVYRPPEVLSSEGAGAGGAGAGGPGYGYGYGSGYPYYGGGGGGGRGGAGGYRGPAYYGQEQPYRPIYRMRPDIPAWLQAMVTWNIGG